MDGVNVSAIADPANLSSFVHNKKLVNMSGDVHLDSGYASSVSISYNQSMASIVHSPLISTSAVQSSKRSIDLEPIAEHFEQSVSPSVVETPTTRSMRQLSEFHIQTPENARRTIETTPTKSSYRFNDLCGGRNSTPKKNRTILSSPYQTRHQKLMTADKLKPIRDSDSDMENRENSVEMSGMNQSFGFSPITYNNRDHASSAAATITSDSALKRTALQRHPSGIESSTPVSRTFKRTNTQTVAKSHFQELGDTAAKRLMRKVQSFSPRKFGGKVLREISSNFQELEQHTEEDDFDVAELTETAVTEDQYNPARKMLSFSTNQFKNLIGASPKKKTEHTQAPPTHIPTRPAAAEPGRVTAKPRLLRQARIVAAVDQSTRPEQKAASGSPVFNQEAMSTLAKELTTKPRKLKRSLTSEPAASILPPKSITRRALKRAASSDRCGASKTKRKLFTTRRSSFDGVERVDVLSLLNERSIKKAVDSVLSMLSDDELLAASRVSTTWQRIVDESSAASSRLAKHWRETRDAKENYKESAPSLSVERREQKKPFTRRNTTCDYMLRSTAQRSPPVSPSKRLFQEHQKVTICISITIMPVSPF